MGFDETSEGADYLSALKRSGSPQVAESRGTPAKAPAPIRANPTRAEKRQTPRYKCKGSARLQERGSAVATWATFADISMFGCYVEAATPLRVGTMLGLKLELNGFRIEASGEVRVAYPSLGMGISFVKISEKDREQLRELVNSISRRPSATLSAESASLTIPHFAALPAVSNPAAALQALHSFFANRHVMGREEFLKILRQNQ
jgi:hypothetical protein